MNKYQNIIDVLEDIGEDVRRKYREELKLRDKYATGKLLDSINYKVVVGNNGITLYFLADDYYIYVENGRKAGGKFPPINAIKSWMISRGIPDENGRSYLIARSIQRNGIKPNPYLKEIRTDTDSYTQLLTNALKKDIWQF